MKRFLFFVLILALAVLTQSYLTAQEEEKVTTNYSYGSVKSITSGQIVVTEYDAENDEELDVIYVITPESKYEGADSYTDVSAGDSVDIEYVIQAGKKTAVLILIEEPVEDEILIEEE